MTSTLESIKRRDPDAAVASHRKLLEEDRDRALESLSPLRGESLDLSALSQPEAHPAPGDIARAG